MIVPDAVSVLWDLPRFRGRVRDLLVDLPLPDSREPITIYQPHPIRVLLIGSGHALGYGVHDRGQALDGHLARGLADRLDRGVSVHNHARRGVRLASQIIRAQAEFGFGFFDLVVWCPSHLEMTERLHGGSWSRSLSALLAAADGATVVVLQLAVPEGGDRVARSAARVIAHINAGIRRAASRFPSVTVATPPPIRVVGAGLPSIDSYGYRVLAERVTESAVALLGSGASHGETAPRTTGTRT